MVQKLLWLTVDTDDGEIAAQDDAEDDADFKPRTTKPRKRLSKDLPRIQKFIYLSHEEREGAIETFFVKVKEELDIIPAKAQVIEIQWDHLVRYCEHGQINISNVLAENAIRPFAV